MRSNCRQFAFDSNTFIRSHETFSLSPLRSSRVLRKAAPQRARSISRRYPVLLPDDRLSGALNEFAHSSHEIQCLSVFCTDATPLVSSLRRWGSRFWICPSVLEPKFFKDNHLKDGVSARGALEPACRVVFSAIFHGVSLGSFHQHRNL